MEKEGEDARKPYCISSTNWIVSEGSLDDSISFETPISSIYDEQEDFQDSKSLKNQLLVLNPPPSSSSSSSDSTPCEIKLSFEQRHEIRQVYVRSSARIFEIYYATEPQSSNEYLCTVRCGIVSKEDVQLGTSDTEELTSADLQESTSQKDPHEDKIKSDSSSNTDEDGWVEVKAPDSTLLNSKTCSVAKSDGRSVQDFYEATAEISDSSPCTTVTLRLLSLHTKGCIHLEEIYIFGEPVEPTESDDKVDPLKRSADGSMMAMLVPTLLQLSKTGMTNRARDKHVPDVRQEFKHQDSESADLCIERTMQEGVQSSLPSREKAYVNADESRDPCISRTVQEEAESSLPVREKAGVESASKKSPELTEQSDEPVSGAGQGPESVTCLNDSPSNRLERVLDHLICRVGRIESFCSRFEENMLKPISNIETRLERIEQQLAVLTMRSQPPELFVGTRIIAPDFSCIESETNSLQNEANEGHCCDTSDYARKDIKLDRPKCFSDESGSCSPLNVADDNYCGEPGSFFNDDASYSGAAPQFYPCLKITAPEFSVDNNDEDNDASHHGGVGTGDDKDCADDSASSCSVKKPPLSLDNALAMALAGFMSTAAQPPKISDSCIDAYDSSDKKYGGNDSLNSPARSVCRQHADSELNGTHNSKILDSPSSCSPRGNVDIMRLPSDDSTKAVIRDCPVEEGIDRNCDDKSVNQNTLGNNDEVGEDYSVEDVTDGFATLRISRGNVGQVMELPCDSSTEAVIRGCLLQEEGIIGDSDGESVNQTIIGNSNEIAGESNEDRMEDTTNGIATPAMENPNLRLNEEDVKEPFVANPGYEGEVADTVLQRSFNSTVDFELPVLDVKFTASEHSQTRGSLESLLGDASESKVEDSCAEDKGDLAFSTAGEVSVEKESQEPAVDHLLVEIDDAEVLNNESKTEGSFNCSSVETVLWNLL